MLKIKSNSWEDVVMVKKTVINEKYCDKKKYAEYQKAGKGGRVHYGWGGGKVGVIYYWWRGGVMIISVCK